VKGPHFERGLRFMRDRFHPENYLGLRLTIGLLAMVLGGWSFSEVAEGLGPSEELAAVDQEVAGWFYQRTRPPLTAFARIVTSLGSVGFLIAASVVSGLFLVRRRSWDWLLALVLTMGGGSLLNVMLKHFFHRQRPVFENPLVTLTSFGFPSGHTMGSTLFFGLLAIIAAHTLKPWRWRLVAVATACLLVAAIGLTRIYLGAHYLSDVLAALAAGLVWLAFCWTTVETFRRRREEQAKNAAPVRATCMEPRSNQAQ